MVKLSDIMNGVNALANLPNQIATLQTSVNAVAEKVDAANAKLDALTANAPANLQPELAAIHTIVSDSQQTLINVAQAID